MRRTVSTTSYTALCYSTAAARPARRLPRRRGRSSRGYCGHDLAAAAGPDLGAQLLGHSLFNLVLRTTSATVVSLALLLEVPGAALIAAVCARPDAAAGGAAGRAAAAGGHRHRRLVAPRDVEPSIAAD